MRKVIVMHFIRVDIPGILFWYILFHLLSALPVLQQPYR